MKRLFTIVCMMLAVITAIAQTLTGSAPSHVAVGEQFRLARLRRNLTIEQIADRAQCSRLTVAKLEKGLPTVSLGVVLRVLYALQLDTDILLLAKDDALGRDIQDIELKNRKRASKKS